MTQVVKYTMKVKVIKYFLQIFVIWKNGTGKKWGARYTFWYIVLLTLCNGDRRIVQCMSAASYKRQGILGECLDPWALTLRWAQWTLICPAWTFYLKSKRSLQPFKAFTSPESLTFSIPWTTLLILLLKREINSSRLLVGCQQSRKNFQTSGGWERWENRSSFWWRYPEKVE